MDNTARIAELKRKKLAIMREVDGYKQTHACEFFKPYKWQDRAFAMIREKNVVIAPAPNKIGKSAAVMNILISCALGYEPWTKSDIEVDGWVKSDKYWYRPSVLGKKPPIVVRITGEDWTHHIGQVLIPELRKWAPKGMYETRKNSQGVEYEWKWKNGSVFEIMSHDQDLKLFESWLGDLWVADEPPKKEIYDAMGRGLFLRGGKVVMFITPLSQAWLLDELIEPTVPRNDVGVIDGLTFLDNEDLYRHDYKLLKDFGYSESEIVEYFRLCVEYDDLTKDEHVMGLDRHLRKHYKGGKI